MIQRPRGTDDLLPDDLPKWRRFEQVARDLCERWGYREIRTPHFEATELFQRGIGEETDIVGKEMFTFARGEESFTLRPELTAPIVRAYLENHLHKSAPFQKFYAFGPNFRAERPAAGRRRQFWQVGVEVLGTTHPLVDAETVLLMDRFFKALGLAQFRFDLNAIGGRRDPEHQRYLDALRAYLRPHRDRLSPESQQRLERNVLRILDSKSRADREILEDAPCIGDYLGESHRAHFETILRTLDRAGVSYCRNPNLVRGFDYYTHFVYECVHTGLDAAQNALGGGGRYNHLVEELGGPPTGCVGFGIGVDRTLMALEAEGRKEAFTEGQGLRPHLFIVCQDSALREEAFSLALSLRERGLGVELDHEERSFKSQMRAADKSKARFVIIAGAEEAAARRWSVKNLATGEQVRLASEDIPTHVA